MISKEKNYLGSQIEIMICIERSFPESSQFIEKKINDECSLILNKYQTDLSYQQYQLGSDMNQLYKKLSLYCQVAENLLIEYRPCQKLGYILRGINYSFKQLFNFLKTYTLRRKHYIQERLKELQSKLQVGYCNRCNKYIKSRNIQETKVLIGAGQFSDPFNLYEVGACDFITNRNKEQDDQYKLKYAEVWQNKKNIQEKFHSLQVQMDKRSYGYTFTVQQIKKFQSVVDTIVRQMSQAQKPKYQTQKQFRQNMVNLLNNVYHKIQQYKDNQIYKDQGVQVGMGPQSKLCQELKEANEKLIKKNKQLNKKNILKDKQIIQIANKLTLIQQQKNKRNFQRSSNQQVIKNLITQHVQDENKLDIANFQLKNVLLKSQTLQKQIEALKLQLTKFHNFIQIKIDQQKINSNIKSYKTIKSRGDINQYQKNNEISMQFIRKSSQIKKKNNQPQNRRISIKPVHKRQPSERSSMSKQKEKSNKKQKSLLKQRRNTKDQKKQQSINEQKILQQILSQKKTLGVQFSRNNVKRLTQIRQQNSISVRQVNQYISTQQKDQGVITSLQLIQTDEDYQKRQKQQSVIYKKKSMKSLRKIKRRPSTNKIKIQINQPSNQISRFKQLQNKNQNNVEQQKIVDVISKKERKIDYKQTNNAKKTKAKISAKKALQKQTKPLKNTIKGQSKQQNEKVIKKFHSMHNNKRINNDYEKQFIIQKSKDSKLHQTSLISKNKSRQFKIQHNQVKQNQIRSLLPRLSMEIPNQNSQKIDAYAILYKYYKKIVIQFSSKQQNNKQIYDIMKAQQNELIYVLTLEQFKIKIQQFIKTLCFLSKETQFINNKKIFDFNKSISFSKFKKIEYKDQNKENSFKISQNQDYFGQKINKTVYKFKLTTQQEGNQQQRIKNIAKKMSKMFFNQQLAYLTQKSQTYQQLINYNTNINSNLNSLDCTVAPKEAELYKNSQQSVFKKTKNNLSMSKLDKIQLNSMHSTITTLQDSKINNLFGQNILKTNQLKYLKIINILLVKLHNKDQRLFQIIKKSVIYPYSYLSQHILTKTYCHFSYISQIRNIRQRKSVGAFLNPNSNGFLLRQALLKLIIIHRRCGVKTLFKQKTDSLSKLSCIKIKKQQKVIENKLDICFHLQQLKTILQNELIPNIKLLQSKDAIVNKSDKESSQIKQKKSGSMHLCKVSKNKIDFTVNLSSQSSNIDICPWS